MRRLVATLTIAGLGAVAAACGLALSTRRRRRRITADAPTTDIILQQFTRTRAPDGAHSIHATLLAEFTPGDRVTTLHVAFCPPFERLPAVEIEVTDDSSASVKVTQLLHNGVQLEARLPHASTDNQTATIELLVTDAW